VFAIGIALLLYPFVLSGPFYWDVGVTFLLAAISASAWNLVGGYAGQVSVGHAMFFGIGAYVPLLVFNMWGWPTMAGVPIASCEPGLALVIHPDVPPAGHSSAWRPSRWRAGYLRSPGLRRRGHRPAGPRSGAAGGTLTFRSGCPTYLFAVLACCCM
jgi:hypothetical protein